MVALAGLFVSGRKPLLGLFIVGQRHTHLPEVVRALRLAARFAHPLNGREQKSDQRADDGKHRQQLNQREADADGCLAADGEAVVHREELGMEELQDLKRGRGATGEQVAGAVRDPRRGQGERIRPWFRKRELLLKREGLRVG